MTGSILVQAIDEWLIDRALGKPDMVGMFEELCERIYTAGIPIGRAMVTWTTLHPLVDVEQATWLRKDGSLEHNQISHDEDLSEGWQRSPMRYLIEHRSDLLRRHLTGPEKLLDYPLLEDLAAEGYTDYIAMTVPFALPNARNINEPRGMVMSWTSDATRGFTDDDVAALQQLKKRYAVAAKTAIYSKVTENIAETYLGKQAGKRVLAGQIRRGDGQATDSVVWYSDLRGSTQLADTLPAEQFRSMLNDYFEAMAGAAINAGGEVLDFIGDAVLAIFPIAEAGGISEAAAQADTAISQAVEAMSELNTRRLSAGEPPLEFGLGLNRGEVMFGNIGVPERLTFSVIGPIVNEVARIEGLTKALGEPILATREIAEHMPDIWESAGRHDLAGISQPIELFAWRGAAGG